MKKRNDVESFQLVAGELNTPIFLEHQKMEVDIFVIKRNGVRIIHHVERLMD